MTSAEPASRLYRLLRQLERVCYAHGGAALSCSGRAMGTAPPQSGPSLMGPAAACRGMHTRMSGGSQASRLADSYASNAQLLPKTSSRLAAGNSAPFARRHTSSALTGLAVQASAASPSEGGSGPRSANIHGPAAWQQERRHSWTANAVQPAVAGVPAGQYAPHFQPHTRPHWREPVVIPLGVQSSVQQPLAQPPPAVTVPSNAPAWQGMEVAGVVQRVTYRAQETGYCVLKLKVSL